MTDNDLEKYQLRIIDTLTHAIRESSPDDVSSFDILRAVIHIAHENAGNWIREHGHICPQVDNLIGHMNNGHNFVMGEYSKLLGKKHES